MRLAISNLAWNTADDESVASLLGKYAIDAIDVAPGKYFPDIKASPAREIDRVRTWWQDRGTAITGMQALLFGTSGLNVFGDPAIQKSMLEHLDAIARIGAGLGATRLVFGSPKNRDRSALSNERTRVVAVDFFRRLGDIASSRGVVFCLEPNPVCYGANFMTDSAETAEVVEAVAHPAIRMQLDTGAITINGEDPALVVEKYGALIGHVHASEPDLVTLGDGKTDHAAVASALEKHLPSQIVSIEMLPAKNEANPAALERAIGVATHYYRGGKEVRK